MSHLKILVCSLLVGVTTLAATSANAQNRWPGSLSTGCGRTSGYPAMSGGYRQPVQSYDFSGSANYGARQPQMNYGFGSQGYDGPSGCNNQYVPNRGYDRGVSQRYGAYGYNNSARNSEMEYGSIHGDYYPVSRGTLRQPMDYYRSDSQSPYNSHGFNSGAGW